MLYPSSFVVYWRIASFAVHSARVIMGEVDHKEVIVAGMRAVMV